MWFDAYILFCQKTVLTPANLTVCARLSLHLLQRLLTARVTQCLCTAQPVLRSTRPPEDGEIPKFQECLGFCVTGPNRKLSPPALLPPCPSILQSYLKWFYHLWVTLSRSMYFMTGMILKETPKLPLSYHFPGSGLALCTNSQQCSVSVLSSNTREPCSRASAPALNEHWGSKFHDKSHVSHFPQECEQASWPDSSGIWTWVWPDQQLSGVRETPSVHYNQL